MLSLVFERFAHIFLRAELAILKELGAVGEVIWRIRKLGLVRRR